MHLRPTQFVRDPHSFAPGDPPVEVPRRLATELLERMAMARDHVEHVGGVTDDWGRRLVAQLTSLLTGDPS